MRAPSEEDLEQILILWMDPNGTRHIGGPRERSVVLDHFLEYVGDPEGFVHREAEWWWSVHDVSRGTFVGLCCLLKKEVEGQTAFELGYFLLSSCSGRGLAIEAVRLVAGYAFSTLHLDSVVAVIDPQNLAPIAVARKLGMWLDRSVERSDAVTRCVYRLRRTDWEERGSPTV